MFYFEFEMTRKALLLEEQGRFVFPVEVQDYHRSGRSGNFQVEEEDAEEMTDFLESLGCPVSTEDLDAKKKKAVLEEKEKKKRKEREEKAKAERANRVLRDGQETYY